MTESKKSLLQSNLGSGSVGLYRSICEELGRSLEAVTPQTLQVAQLERDHPPREEVSLAIPTLGQCNTKFGYSLGQPVQTRRKAALSRQRSASWNAPIIK